MFEIYGIILFFILGAILGSFANVVIYRLPVKKSVVFPRSHCQSCKKMISFYDNIPLLSYFLLRGKCRHCQQKFSARYVAVEWLTAFIFVALYMHLGWSWLLLEYSIFSLGIVIVSMIDLDHRIIPDVISLPGIGIGLLGAMLNPSRSFSSAILGVLIGGGFLWLVAYLYWILRKQEGMGGGDIKMLAWIGAVLGWTSIPFVILVASILGSIVGVISIYATKGQRKEGFLSSAIPFGPFLGLAALLYILAGAELANWYFRIFIPI